jgi:PAT family beta-lactamase induction signal transducer AmpG
MLLAHAGHNYPLMVASIALENFFSGMGNAAYMAFLMSLCDHRFTATQFALLSSLMAQARVWGGAPTGYLVKAMGWGHFFLLCTAMAAPGLLLLTRYKKWRLPKP